MSRPRLTDAEKKSRKAAYARARRANATDEQKARKNARRLAYERVYRVNATDEQRERRKERVRKYQRSLRGRFKDHRDNASRRGIPFKLSFDEWLHIWEASGHLHERGSGHGRYCMARHDDIGPYAIGNVEIILHSQNTSDGHRGRPPARGRKLSPEHRSKLIEGLRRYHAKLRQERREQP